MKQNSKVGFRMQQFVEILKYATERHIEVIPEIDMPGHARAAIRSMQVRYNKYMEQLELSSGISISTFMHLLTALSERHDFFHEQGCRISGL